MFVRHASTMFPLGASLPAAYATDGAASTVVGNTVLSKVRRVSVVSFIGSSLDAGRTRGAAPGSDGEYAGASHAAPPPQRHTPLPPRRSLFESIAYNVPQPCKIVSAFFGDVEAGGALRPGAEMQNGIGREEHT